MPTEKYPVYEKYTLAEYVVRVLIPAIKQGAVFTAVHVHGTDKPDHASFKKYGGLFLCQSMWRYHTGTQGWGDIAQHATIDPEGYIWACRSLLIAPASATGHNESSPDKHHPFMFEMIGQFDKGNDVLEGPQMASAVGLTKAVIHLMEKGADIAHFHRDYTNKKTCPGTGVDRADFMRRVIAAPYVLDAAPAPEKPTEPPVIAKPAPQTAGGMSMKIVVNGKRISDGILIGGVTYVPARELLKQIEPDSTINRTAKDVVTITTKTKG